MLNGVPSARFWYAFIVHKGQALPCESVPGNWTNDASLSGEERVRLSRLSAGFGFGNQKRSFAFYK